MTKILDSLYSVLWGPPIMLLIMIVGIVLTVCTHCIQLRLLPSALRFAVKKAHSTDSEVSPFQALCSALAATIGTGNLVGVSGAISLGGPGAVLWMQICALGGMVIKYAEATLAVRFQHYDGKERLGGPMYMIQLGLGKQWLPLAYLYCSLGIAASFGVGNLVQTNAIVTSLSSISCFKKIPPLAVGFLLSAFVGIAYLRGAASIIKATERIVPFAAGSYVVLCVIFLLLRVQILPHVLSEIWQGAFCPRAITGGVVGSALKTLQIGCSRGVFSNEAGMGTASIAHGSAGSKHPVQQGMMGILEVFLDTFVICTLTALVVLTSGIDISYGTDQGAKLTILAFSVIYQNFGAFIVFLYIAFFSYATILGWSLYGLRCIQFIVGRKASALYFLLQTAVVIMGSVSKAPIVWRFAEVLNGLMVIPNLIVILLLTPELLHLTKEFSSGMRTCHWR